MTQQEISAPKEITLPTCSMNNVSYVYSGGPRFETGLGHRIAQLFRGFLQFLEAHSKVDLKLGHNYLYLLHISLQLCAA